MNILLIGGTGFIGSQVVAQLENTDHKLAIFHRGKTYSEGFDQTIQIKGDRARLAEFKEQFKQFAPDIVIDIIPYTKKQAEIVTDVFDGIASRFIAISSCDVFRNYNGFRGASDHDPDPTPLKESAPLRGSRFPYRGFEGLEFEHKHNYEKILVEKIVLDNSDLPGTVLRMPAIYGPGDKQHRFYPYIKRIKDERPAILLSPSQAQFRWTHGYIKNLAHAIVKVTLDDRATNKIYNLGEPQTPNIAQRIKDIGKILNWSGTVKTIPENNLPEHLSTGFNWNYHLETDTTTIREELNCQDIISYNQALKQTIKWELEHPPTEMANQFNYQAEDKALENVA